MDDLKLEPVVDALDNVAEPLRPFYRKGGDGKFNLITAESIDKLESTLARTKAEREEAKKRADAAKTWEGLGKTPEEIQELLAAEEQRALKDAEAKGEWDKIKQQIEANHAKELEKRDGILGRYRSALENRLIDAEATSAIAEMKGVPALLLPHVRDRVKVEETDDGDFRAVVLTPDRKSPMLNSKNEPMSVKELVAAMREDETFGRAFDGSGHSGGGGQGGSGGGRPSFKKSEMSTKQKAEFMREHGAAAYQALPA
jgi:hypothetical protein